MATNRGVVYIGPGKVEVQGIDYPKIVAPNAKEVDHGVILRIVSTNICGSDQHMVRGRTTAPSGLVLGHEITGEVIEKGPDDPGGIDEAAKTGSLSIRLGLGWSKSHAFQTFQTPVLRYNRQLMQAILHDKIQIAKAVNVMVIRLEDAPKGYVDFDKGAAKKFVLDPHALLEGCGPS